jgi:hypothetical protein
MSRPAALLLAMIAGLLLAPAYSERNPPATEPAPAPERSADQDALTVVATGLLADWIMASRDLALAEGTDAMPPAIRQALAGYVPDAVLDAARWRAGGGSSGSLQQGMFMFGDSPAITLGQVIVFATLADAKDPKLWAHEIMHVMQFKRWGVVEFARRYIADYNAVEAEAVEFRWQWMKETGRIPPPGGSLP